MWDPLCTLSKSASSQHKWFKVKSVVFPSDVFICIFVSYLRGAASASHGDCKLSPEEGQRNVSSSCSFHGLGRPEDLREAVMRLFCLNHGENWFIFSKLTKTRPFCNKGSKFVLDVAWDIAFGKSALAVNISMAPFSRTVYCDA